MKKSLLAVSNIKDSGSTSGAYTLVLEEVQGKRKLGIVIGMNEAQSIAIKLEGMTPSRPLTHDLLQSVSSAFGIALKEVLIYDLVEGIFFARLLCEREGKEEAIDARSSDAVALAVRFGCPIYCDEKVMEAAAILPEGEEALTPMPEENEDDPFGLEEGPVDPGDGLSDLTDEELQEELDLSIQKEDYERAGLIRDVLERRQS
ncbi:MAG: bifunctional nuclease family protein [Crocinitomicaceae bacterium TMED114]|nr:MAG: bifunctional nuclease family protein [Crocinitomicaceae bacterium TMED114]